MATTSSRLSELAQVIAKNTEVLEKYYHQRNLPLPSFEIGGPVDTTICDDADSEKARVATIEASIELRDLLDGPTMQLRPILNATGLQTIYRFDIPSKVPANGEISYQDLAQQCGLELDILRRVLRFAISHHRILQEKREGFVSHSAASKLLADSPDALACVGLMFDDAYQGFARTAEALQKFPKQTPSQCGWTLANQVNEPIFVINQKQPQRGARMSKAMRQLSRGFGADTISMLQGWDWAGLAERNPNNLVVDVGGANGHASVLLANLHPNLHFEVQDLPEIIEAAREDIPPNLRHRISLRAHDFKTPQPTQADVYFLRQILHDWPDSECIKILRALVPAMKPGARVVVNDILVSPPGTVSPLAEKFITSRDMIVMMLCGGKERDKNDWEKLFNDADARFTNVTATQSEGSCIAIIEATWSG